MRRWAVIQHVPYEGLGLIAGRAAQRGLEFDTRRMDRGEQLPDTDEIGGLVVMGGPMGVDQTDEYPFLSAEKALIKAAADRELPVLGVCLGAQLLASALGAPVFRGTANEIGLGTVELTAGGIADPVLGPSGPQIPVFHWHEDTFDLPNGATCLAESDLYANQAFRAGANAYGLQFHVELDRELAEDLAPHLPPAITLDEEPRAAVERTGSAIVDRFFDVATGPQGHERLSL